MFCVFFHELTFKGKHNSSVILEQVFMVDVMRTGCVTLCSTLVPYWKELVDALLFGRLCLVENQEGQL